ncbi:38967_t:CDS:2, partial [Gigaspora margarita]
TNPKITQSIVPFNFQRWMSHLQFEQIVSYHTLMMPNELDAPNFNDPLYSVHSFINAFNSNLIEAVRPGNTFCIDESMNSCFTNIIIQLEPCEEKEIEKKKQFTSEY